MIKDECIFCKIIQNQIPSSKFWENDNFIAILDLFPNTRGASLVISRQHLPSDIFKCESKVIHDAFNAAKEAAALLSKALKPSRISLVTEGIFVDHLHIKLYPLYGVDEFLTNDSNGKVHAESVFFDKFPGFVTTQTGPMWKREDLDGLAKELIAEINKN